MTKDEQPAAPGPRNLQPVLAVAVAVAGLIWLWQQGGQMLISQDLRAVWMAGRMWSGGQLDQIYPAIEPLFRLHAPEGWAPILRAEGNVEGELFPFIYPPIWAAAASLVAGVELARLAQIALVVNCLALGASLWLAIRIAQGALPAPVHALIVMILLGATAVGILPLIEGQPHILVTLLLLLAVDLTRTGRLGWAGAALALAASIKLFPLIFVVLWAARGQWRAVGAFALVGAALAGLSVALAGWALHATFLEVIAMISRTTMINGALVSAEAILVNLPGAPDPSFVAVAPLDGGGERGFFVLATPLAWSLLRLVAIAVALGLIARAIRRADARAAYAALWPLALTLFVVLLPTGWFYYLLPGLFLAPAMLSAHPRLVTGLCFAAGALLLSFGIQGLLTSGEGGILAIRSVAGCVAALFWSAGFAVSARHSAAQN